MKGEMSISKRRGVISLLPKEDANLLKLANWGPITLLNVDYKIASKVIATRLEKVLDLLRLSERSIHWAKYEIGQRHSRTNKNTKFSGYSCTA